jgi:hypothetical protein
VINVAFGGTLYQDIATQLPGSIEHRNARLYDQNFHTIEVVPGTRLAELYPHPGFQAPDRPLPHHVVNSVHHQGLRDLAPFFAVEARCPNDGVIEAIRYDCARGPVQSYLACAMAPEFRLEERVDLVRRRACSAISSTPRARRRSLLPHAEHHQSADGRVIAELPDDTAESVAAAYGAPAAQPRWADQPLAGAEVIRRFRPNWSGIERLAALLTSEVGGRSASRAAINGLLGRIDFF